MGNDILISVIIPVYNSEKFLERSVQSVLCQMNGSVELILVNDGSTDGSAALCDQYAAQHKNVRVIHKENGGVSTTRNAGIAAANGAYLMYLDADDYLEENTFCEVSKVINTMHPDCIDFGWRYVSNGEPLAPAFHALPKDVLLGEQELSELILPPLLNLRNDPDNFIFDFLWNKVFRLDLIRDNQVCFDEGRRTWEDRPFIVQYLRCCHNYYAIGQCFYNYVDVPGSLSRRYSKDFFRIILENFQLYKRLYGDVYDFDTQYVNSHWCRSIENMIFRTFEQIEITDQIRTNMMQMLSDAQVVHWFENRKPNNQFEHMVSEMVVSGKYRAAFLTYHRKWLQKKRKQKYEALLCMAKQMARKLVGR